MNKEMLALADTYFAKTLEANSAEPYDHKEYEKWLSCAKAALVIACDGDIDFAYALTQCFHDSNESMEYYVNKWGREVLVNDYCYGEDMRLVFSEL